MRVTKLEAGHYRLDFDSGEVWNVSRMAKQRFDFKWQAHRKGDRKKDRLQFFTLAEAKEWIKELEE